MAFVHLITKDDLCEYIASLHRLPGLPQAQELAPRVTHLAESHGESWQRCRILDAGFPCPQLQLPVIDSYGIERRLDMAYEEVRVATEYDGREFHTAQTDRDADVARRSDLSIRRGWRFTHSARTSESSAHPQSSTTNLAPCSESSQGRARGTDTSPSSTTTLPEQYRSSRRGVLVLSPEYRTPRVWALQLNPDLCRYVAQNGRGGAM